MCSLRHVVSSGGTKSWEMLGVSVGGVTGVLGGFRQSYSMSSGGSSAVMGGESSYCWKRSSREVGSGLSGDRAFATLPRFVSHVVCGVAKCTALEASLTKESTLRWPWGCVRTSASTLSSSSTTSSLARYVDGDRVGEAGGKCVFCCLRLDRLLADFVEPIVE